MRLFENLLLLSYLPALLAPFWPPTTTRPWRLAAALVPLALLGAQLAVEGARTEMALGYAMIVLALLLGGLSLLPRQTPQRPARRWAVRLARTGAGLSLLPLALAAMVAAVSGTASRPITVSATTTTATARSPTTPPAS